MQSAYAGHMECAPLELMCFWSVRLPGVILEFYSKRMADYLSPDDNPWTLLASTLVLLDRLDNAVVRVNGPVMTPHKIAK